MPRLASTATANGAPPAIPVARACFAIAVRLSTPNNLAPVTNAKPRAAEIAIRTPVKLPGPIVAQIRSSAARATPLSLMTFLLESGVLGLNTGGIIEDDLGQVFRGRRRHDRPGESFVHEPGDEAAMVQVRMRQQQVVD